LSFFIPARKAVDARWEMVAPPPPSEHLGLFCGNQKTQIFASFATNGNTARVKIAP